MYKREGNSEAHGCNSGKAVFSSVQIYSEFQWPLSTVVFLPDSKKGSVALGSRYLIKCCHV